LSGSRSAEVVSACHTVQRVSCKPDPPNDLDFSPE